MERILTALDTLSPREKMMVGVMAAAVILFVGFLGVFFMGTRLADLETGVIAKREALATFNAKKGAFLLQKAGAARGQQDKIDGNDLNLTTFADQHAKAVGINFDDFKDSRRPLFMKKRGPGARNDDPPDLFEEQLEVTFKRVELASLTAFMNRVDNEKRRPVAMKKLNVKTLWSDRSKLSGSLTLATWKKPVEEP